jgi:hypothetical protein
MKTEVHVQQIRGSFKKLVCLERSPLLSLGTRINLHFQSAKIVLLGLSAIQWMQLFAKPVPLDRLPL